MECKSILVFLFLSCCLIDGWIYSNDKATFYTDTMPSSHLRGRQSIVPYVQGYAIL
jgi:hypothetical protein